MFRALSWADSLPFILVAANLVRNVVANASFKFSAIAPNWQGFLAWQVLGNLAGFATVITLTGLLRFLPLHFAYPLVTGLAVVGVQVVAAAWIFHEPMARPQWLGTLLVVMGIALIAQGR